MTIKSRVSTEAEAQKAMNDLGFTTNLDPPRPFDIARDNGKLAIPATVIDLAAMSHSAERFTWAVEQDRTTQSGAVAKASSPLCMLAGHNHEPTQPKALSQMKVVIDHGFDVNAKEFAGNPGMLERLKARLGRSSNAKSFQPLTPLEKACDALFVDAVELLVSNGAKTGIAAEKLAKYDDLNEEEDQAKVKAIKAILKI